MEDLVASKIGDVAYVLGNGPSLDELNIEDLLKKESFWVNRAYRLSDRGIDFKPKYYCVSDPVSFSQFGEHYMSVDAEHKFFREDVYEMADPKDGIYPFRQEAEEICDGYFGGGKIYRGFTVVLDAIQIAYLMGYKEVYVGGVDLDYSLKYFYNEYGPGNMPTDRVKKCFEVALDHFKKDGRVLKKLTHSPNLPLEKV